MRCRNCGLLGHKTQHCPSFGPAYPEPGKTFADYADEYVRIQNLVAADVLAEHYGDDHDHLNDVFVEEEPLRNFKGNKKGGKKAAKKAPATEGIFSSEEGK